MLSLESFYPHEWMEVDRYPKVCGGLLGLWPALEALPLILLKDILHFEKRGHLQMKITPLAEVRGWIIS